MNDFTGSAYLLLPSPLSFLSENNSIWIPNSFGSQRVAFHYGHHIRGKKWRLYGALLSLVKLKSNRRMKPNEIGSMGELAWEIPECFLYLTLLAFSFSGLWVKRESRNKRAAYFFQVFWCVFFCFFVFGSFVFSYFSSLQTKPPLAKPDCGGVAGNTEWWL